MDLRVYTGVCQLKEDICRHALHSFSKHCLRPPINQALCWPTLGTRLNSVSSFKGDPHLVVGGLMGRECSSPG